MTDRPNPLVRLRRRPMLVGITGGAASFGALGIASRLGVLGSAGSPGAEGVLQLHEASPGMKALDVELGSQLLPQVAPQQWRSADLPTSAHSMLAFTWTSTGTDPTFEVSSRRRGQWSPFREVPRLHDLPDPGSGEGGGVTGTELIWIGESDGVRIRMQGARPNRLTLVLLHPGRRGTDRLLTTVNRRDPRTSARHAPPTILPWPEIQTRKAWGADPAWRDGESQYVETIRQVHVHHTVNSNDYDADDVPALLRGMYRYHTQNLGWSDIGYNFLVDRFGRIWAGRAGGPARPVRGAHTLGFNHNSTGIAAIGNYDLARPTTRVVTAIAEVAAWKLGSYARHPQGRVKVRSEGSDKFRAGSLPELPVIDGHRDTNDTACPGRHLYEALPRIRRRAAARIDRFANPIVSIEAPFTIAGSSIEGQTLQVAPGTVRPSTATATCTWLRDGAPIAGATAVAYRLSAADVGREVSVRVDVRAADFKPAVQVLGVGRTVRAAARVVVKASSRGGRATVRVRVLAPASTSLPSGQVTVSLPDRRKSVTLVEGRAIVRFRKPGKGSQTVRANYLGSSSVAPSSSSTSVVIGKRRTRQ